MAAAIHRGYRPPQAGCACAACACWVAAAVKVFALAPHPDDGDVAAIAHRIDNQRDAAGQFAADFVAAVLTTRVPNTQFTTVYQHA